jgi:hypothetical protein
MLKMKSTTSCLDFFLVHGRQRQLMQIQLDPSAFPYLIFCVNERCEPHPDDVRRPEARTAAAAVHDRGWRRCTSGREASGGER